MPAARAIQDGDYKKKVQELPRNSIKKQKYNFADLLGDINYIGDEKLPQFSKSRGLLAKHIKNPPDSTRSAHVPSANATSEKRSARKSIK